AVLANPCLASDDQLFVSFDVDKDSAVTLEEMKSQKLVIETDEDGDKEVHQADAADEAGSTTPMTFEQKRRLLEDIDQNKDGSINRQEWNRASPDGFMLWKF
ncbi:MAG: hypothetical protein JRC99_13345, partial [Deltaproteobacteria bacterium]|nr:hypothetical protein [Deltaproteobacteria bacterium]